jgi:tight adherence protein B
MIAIYGLMLGSGLLLVASVWLWPKTDEPASGSVGFLGGLRSSLIAAGFERVAPGAFLVVSLCAGTAAGAVVLALIPVGALAVAVGGVVAVAPFGMLSGRARRRRRMMRGTWPDLVDHLLAGIRSGLSLGDAVSALAEVGLPETRAAFEQFERTRVATGTLGPALDELKLRLTDPVADRIVETLRMARDVGGSELPRVLRALSSSLRQDAALRAEVEARQSWVVNAARLGVVAPWLVLLLLAARPEAAAAYAGPAGTVLLTVGLAITVVAYRLMIALGRLPEERRWFA